jgi:hypothetical protein
MKTIILIMAFLFGIVGLVVTLAPLQAAVVNSFEECAAAGYPVAESYPRRCTTPDGRSFVEAVPPDSLAPDKPAGDSGVICTMEAKQCPNGTYVQRVPPNCEFAPCPEEKAQ